jgi:hypothetical protein
VETAMRIGNLGHHGEMANVNKAAARCDMREDRLRSEVGVSTEGCAGRRLRKGSDPKGRHSGDSFNSMPSPPR